MLLFSILIAYNDLYLHKSRNYLSMKTFFLIVILILILFIDDDDNSTDIKDIHLSN